MKTNRGDFVLRCVTFRRIVEQKWTAVELQTTDNVDAYRNNQKKNPADDQMFVKCSETRVKNRQLLLYRIINVLL